MTHRSLTEIIADVGQTESLRLSVYPDVAEHVRASLTGSDTDPESLALLAGRDPSLAGQLLRAANSSFFEGLAKTALLAEAITRLGTARAAEVLREACAPGAASPGSVSGAYLQRLWLHALGCACGAQWLAVRCGYQALAEQVYLAGLLHDIGKLFLLTVLDAAVADDAAELQLSPRIVDEVLESLHVEQGQRLVAAWSLPEFYSRVIGDHHRAGNPSQEMSLALVRLANKGCHKLGLGLLRDADLVLPTTAEAQFLGVDEIALAEFEIMLEDRFLDGQAE
ncbi:MAG: HDOD domain-containing protein [Desulfuromonadales bacterium]|nr:HDOD domain-containing protein [Desulfuromonadales bacterium]